MRKGRNLKPHQAASRQGFTGRVHKRPGKSSGSAAIDPKSSKPTASAGKQSFGPAGYKGM